MPSLPTPSRWLRWQSALVRTLFWLVALAWLLFGLSWGLLHGVIVPRVGEWRPALERLATHALGLPVEIGQLQASSDGPVPSLHLRDVVLRDPDGAEALRLPSVRAALSLPSLWRLGLDQIVIEGAQVELHRRADGRLLIGGIELGALGPDADASPLADWLLSQTELAVLGANLRWRDDTRPQAPALELRNIDAVLRNPGRQHKFRLDATPPPDWGERWSVLGQFSRPLWQPRPSRWNDWRGTLYGHWPALDLQHAVPYLDSLALLGAQLQQGRGALRVWLELERGQVRRASSDLELAHLQLRWPQLEQPLQLLDLRTRLEFEQEARRSALSTHGLAFRTSGTVWPGGNLRLEQQRAPDGSLAALGLQGQQLDAQGLAQLALQLPLPAVLHQALRDTQPSGRAETLRFDWRAARGAAAADWSARASLRDVSLRAGPAPPPQRHPDGWVLHAPGRPGVAGLSLELDLQRSGGSAQVRLQNGHLDLPGVFEQARVPVQLLQTQVRWRVDGAQISAESERLRLRNADLEADLRLRWRSADPTLSGSGARFPGVLELDGQLLRLEGTALHRYLPLAVGADARRYLRHAVGSGRISNAQVRVQGDLWDFPFAQADRGQFSLTAQVHDVALDYAPAHVLPPDSAAWPPLQVAQARLQLERTRLRLDQIEARVRAWPQLTLHQSEAEIPDLLAPEPLLRLDLGMRGPASDALAFVARSPLRQMSAGVLDPTVASGSLAVNLRLDMPLKDTDATQVQGHLRLSGNDVRLSPAVPLLQALQAQFNFTQDGFDLPAAQAQMLGGPLRVTGRMAREGGQPVLRLRGSGQASVQALARAEPWPWLAPLEQLASGSAAYQTELRLGPDGTTLRLDSDLRGSALLLPEPLRKAAPDALALRLHLEPLAGAPAGSRREELRLELGPAAAPLLSLRYQTEQRGVQTRVLRGALALGASAPTLPASGVLGLANLANLDGDAWLRLLHSDAPAAVDAPPEAPNPYWPTQVRLQAQRLLLGGQAVHELSASGQRVRDTWRLNVQARELAGSISYRSGSAASGDHLHARLSHLYLNAPTTPAADAAAEAPHAPLERVPAIDLVAQRLRIGTRELGRLELQAVNRMATLEAGERVNEWRLNQLSLSTPEATLSGSGNWVARANGATERRTALHLQLDVRDAGALLERLGQPETVRGGQGRIEGHLGWFGSPLRPDLPSLGGELRLDLGRGQFLRAEPGVARLLGVLSLQALPRRLMLDFRDVFSEGFTFDFVRGHVQVAQGVARSNNLQMKGVNAAVLMEGSADLVRETQDLRVVVVPELNAGTASLVATIINPITGLGSFLAQFLLRQPLQEAATREFRISGTWAEPQVEPVQRAALAPAPVNTN